MASQQRTMSGVLLCALAFVTLFGYAIARPATESLFLEVHGATMLPWAWLAVALVSTVVVAVYGRAASRLPLGVVMLWAIAISAGVLAGLLLCAQQHIPGAALGLYVWKDVHIVVLLEVMWSFANLVFQTQTARWFNGLFCACGSIGGLLGNLSVGWLAAQIGTRSAPLVLFPLFAVEAWITLRLADAAGQPAPKDKAHIGWGDGLALIRKSPYIGWLVLLIGTVQLAVNLIDYVYQDAIAQAYPNIDARTEVIGQVYAAIDISALTLQLGSGVVLSLIGVRGTLLLVPLALGAATAAFIAAPRFAIMAVLKVLSKAFDYSLFRVAKEMLYIPLNYEEKTRGKALVDMLTYRVAKGGASLLILALGTAGAATAVVGTTLGAIATWLGLTQQVTKRYAARVATKPVVPAPDPGKPTSPASR